MPEFMSATRDAFADELLKVAIAPLAKEMARSTLMSMGFESVFNPDSTPLSVAREGVGFGVGDVGATALARGMGFGRIGQFAAGMLGGSVLANALRKRFADKPVQHAIDKLPDTPEFKAIKQAAAMKSVLTPQSSNVSGYSYDPATQALNVTFKSGGTYTYKGVPKSAVRSLARNKSVGKTINKIKATAEYEKVAKLTAFGEDQYSESDDAGWKDKLPGGAADDKFPEDFDFEALDKGMKHEIEHTKDRNLAMEIAMDHLTEDPNHYEKTAMLRERVREGAPSIIDRAARRRRSMMKSAGVAKKQRNFDGLTLKIEEEPGDIRSGTSREGRSWSRKMHASYGYVAGTGGLGADGEAIDVYLAADPLEGAEVYRVSQNKKAGGFDEHKYMLGYPNAEAAKAEYLRHMPEWAFGSMKAESMDRFRSKYERKAA